MERYDLQRDVLSLLTFDDIIETLIEKKVISSPRYLTAYMTRKCNRSLIKQLRFHSPFPPVEPGQVNWEYDVDMEGYHVHPGYLAFEVDDLFSLMWKYVSGMENTDTVMVTDKNVGVLAIIKNIKREE